MDYNNRPQGRKHGNVTGSGGVNKRGSGLHTGPVGNADYSSRENHSRNYRRRGIGIGGIALILILAFFMNQFNFGDSDTAGWSQSEESYVNASTSQVDESVSDGARDKFTRLTGNDQVTVLVYMIGSNLESDNGMATADLNEMIQASHNDKVNIIVETGGAKRWQNNVVSNDAIERWRIVDHGLQRLGSVKNQAMTNASVLEDFLIWGQQTYPADRYELILWDHGGGSVQGYGYDELYPQSTMKVGEIGTALKNSKIKLDFIGFDACLMANAVTASMSEPYVDYLIASEETEPGTGWYYTDWLSTLAKNPSIKTTQLGKQIVDDYTAHSSGRTTLSLIDLAEYAYQVPDKLKNFSMKLSSDIQSGDYQYISNARALTHEFAASNHIDQIDLIDFAQNLNTEEGNALKEAVEKSVKYNQTRSISNAYGLSIYFPYDNTQMASEAADLYDEVNPDSSYADTIRSFATLEASGQMAGTYSSHSIFDLLNGSEVPADNYSFDATELLNLFLSDGSDGLTSLLGGRSAVNDNELEGSASYISNNHIDPASLNFSTKDGQQVLHMDEADWKLVHSLALNVWANDGSGYIDLGLDNVYNFDDDGDLIVSYDGTWISINNHVVSYYVNEVSEDENGKQITSGYVPAMLNGSRVNILLEFNEDNTDGVVLGAQAVNENGTEGKGLITIQNGDQIDFLCDYYDYNGLYQDSYYLGKPLTVKNGLSVGTYQITNTDLLFGYQIKDIYNTALYTSMIRK